MAKAYKGKYYEKLTEKERHRVRDALYRLRKLGFIIPDEEVHKIKKARTYEEIEKQAVKLSGAVYKPFRYKKGQRAQYEAPAEIGYKALKAHKKYKKEVEQEIKKGVDAVAFPEYSPQYAGPTARDTEKMTKKEANLKFTERLMDITKAMKHGAKKRSKELHDIRLDNLREALEQTVKPRSKELYDELWKKIRKLSPAELHNMYNTMGADVYDALWNYDNPQLGVLNPLGEVVRPLSELFAYLGVDINKEVKVGPTRRKKEKATVYDLFIR